MTMNELFQSMQSGEVVSWNDRRMRVVSMIKDWVTLEYASGPGCIELHAGGTDDIKKPLSAYAELDKILTTDLLGGSFPTDFDDFRNKYGDRLKEMY